MFRFDEKREKKFFTKNDKSVEYGFDGIVKNRSAKGDVSSIGANSIIKSYDGKTNKQHSNRYEEEGEYGNFAKLKKSKSIRSHLMRN